MNEIMIIINEDFCDSQRIIKIILPDEVERPHYGNTPFPETAGTR